MTSTEFKSPLADYAPKTYRRLNPRALKVLASELLGLTGPTESSGDAAHLVAEYVIEQVRTTDEKIIGIQPEDFAAGILARAGVANTIRYPLTDTDKALPIITIENEQFILDFSSTPHIKPLELWLQ